MAALFLSVLELLFGEEVYVRDIVHDLQDAWRIVVSPRVHRDDVGVACLDIVEVERSVPARDE